MPSTNSYNYFACFKACLKRWNKKGRNGWDEKASKYGIVPHYSDEQEAAIISFMRSIMEASPSAAMGADDWCDRFLNAASDQFLCTGTWCHNPRCPNNCTNVPYNCTAGTQPAVCKIYREWRKMWRSYPDSDVCRACKYYKPVDAAQYRDAEERNKYKCYCRAKELPEGCPKRKKGKS